MFIVSEHVFKHLISLNCVIYNHTILCVQFHHFKTMTKDAGKTNIEKMRVQSQDMEGLLEKYQSALQQLPQVLKVRQQVLKV